jgi:hypothetical protein
VWSIDENAGHGNAGHPWRDQNLGVPRYFFDGRLKLKIYGPELFNSVNTAAPYGQNDGALWQGKGYNGSLTGGIRLEAYGVEATFKPQLAFSQNLAFDIMSSAYKNEYGYFWGYGVDAPQRFGDKPFFTWDWGDSEIRYTWRTLTIGFGTQAIWLGPAYLNPMLHSNNAPAYPKFDIGLRRQPLTIPWVNWYIGDVELRVWIGYLSESEYFDSEQSNDHTMFHGFAMAYAPSFLPGLTISANRVCIVDWKLENLGYWIPGDYNTTEDQKFSLGISWFFPRVGFEVYGEMGIDDYIAGGAGYDTISTRFTGYLRHLTHTLIYTFGFRKALTIDSGKNIHGELLFEWNNFEMSQDFQFQWPYSFYFHNILIHGYTNKGQTLGAGSGWAGNSQYLGFTIYYPKGRSSLYLHRNNPDNNFLYSKAVNSKAREDKLNELYYSFKANFIFGLSTEYNLVGGFNIGGSIAYNLLINNMYYHNKAAPFDYDDYMHNFYFSLTLKYNF